MGELRKCTSDVSESWEFGEVNTLSGRWSSENRLLSSELRHVLILLIAVAGVGALSFSAWWMQPKLSATNATPLNAGQQGGVALVSTEDVLVRKRADVNMQGGFESSDSPDFFDENSKEPKIGYTDGMDGSQGQMDKVNKAKKVRPELAALLNTDPTIEFVEQGGTDVNSYDFGLSSDKTIDEKFELKTVSYRHASIEIQVDPKLGTFEDFICGFTSDSSDKFRVNVTSGRMGRRGDPPERIEVTFDPADVKGEFKATLCFVLPDEKMFSSYYSLTGTSI